MTSCELGINLACLFETDLCRRDSARATALQDEWCAFAELVTGVASELDRHDPRMAYRSEAGLRPSTNIYEGINEATSARARGIEPAAPLGLDLRGYPASPRQTSTTARPGLTLYRAYPALAPWPSTFVSATKHLPGMREAVRMTEHGLWILREHPVRRPRSALESRTLFGGTQTSAPCFPIPRTGGLGVDVRLDFTARSRFCGHPISATNTPSDETLEGAFSFSSS